MATVDTHAPLCVGIVTTFFQIPGGHLDQMASGLATQHVKQTGEYLVAAELARRGLIVATFSGNVPDYDLIATDTSGKSVPVQVKAVTKGSWQFDVRDFVDVRLDDKRQVLGAPVPCRVERLIFVMVALKRYGSDSFYVLSWDALRKAAIEHHQKYLEKHGGVRPKRFDSYHMAMAEAELARFRDRWREEFGEYAGLSLSWPD